MPYREKVICNSNLTACREVYCLPNEALDLLKEQKPKIILHGVDGISYANCPNC